MSGSSSLSRAAPFLVSAGYALVYGPIATHFVKFAAKHRAPHDVPNIEVPVQHGKKVQMVPVEPDTVVGASAADFVPYALWGADLNQIATAAMLSPTLGGFISAGKYLLYIYLATIVASVALFVDIALRPPISYVNAADNRINSLKKAGQPANRIHRWGIRISRQLGTLWVVLIQLSAALVAGITG